MSLSLITGGTNIGDMTEAGGLAAAFNGNTNQAATDCSRSSVNDIGFVGKTLSSPKRFGQAVVHGSNNEGYSAGVSNRTIHIRIRGKNGAAPSGPTDGTIIGSLDFNEGTNESAGRTVVSTDISSYWDHLFVHVANDGDGERMLCGELVLFAEVSGGFLAFFD